MAGHKHQGLMFVYVYYVVVSKQTIMYMYNNLGIYNKFFLFDSKVNSYDVLFDV